VVFCDWLLRVIIIFVDEFQFFPHPWEYIVSSTYVILVGIKWNAIVVLICIYQITNVEHLFMSLLAVCISSLRKCLLKTYCFQNWVVLFFYRVVSSSCILYTSLLSDLKFANTFSHSVGSCHFLEDILWVPKF
jgi:hypothetical protein